MKKIEATIVTDSIDLRGNRIISALWTYPRFIHSEVMTHRMFSRNSASSRAIPFEKMVKMVEEDPFIPIAWQKDHKGMQGNEYHQDYYAEILNVRWLDAAKSSIRHAKELSLNSATKQIINRLLEPFMWHTVLVTATEYDNFFELRCPKYKGYFPEESNNVNYFKSKKDFCKMFHSGKLINWTKEQWYSINESQAEIHIQALAEAMWDAKNESTPKKLKSGEWHVPFGDRFDEIKIRNVFRVGKRPMNIQEAKISVATARCARLSYMTFDGEIDYEKDIELHDRLASMRHWSPFEHCARVMSKEEYNGFVKGHREQDKGFDWLAQDSLGWCNNFRGFIPYRYLIENRKS